MSSNRVLVAVYRSCTTANRPMRRSHSDLFSSSFFLRDDETSHVEETPRLGGLGFGRSFA